MSCQATRLDLERFRAAITSRLGLQFDDARLSFLGEVLERRLDKLGASSDVYLHGLERDPAAGEIAFLARHLTVGETYFFRNIEQFRVLGEVALAERMRAPRVPQVLRLLSAGCASGEEAYSMAIAARQAVPDSWTVAIRAVDINPSAIEKAARARYSSWALREAPPDVQRQWFHPHERELVLDQAIRAAVEFETANLATDDPELWQPAAYDVIFCRNVLMYFAPEQMRAVIARIAGSLAPGGFLFLGHAETLRGVSEAFHLRHSHDTFYYELKEHSGSVRRPLPQPIARADRAAAHVMAAPDAGWVEAIRTATERVAALVPSQPVAGPSGDPPPVDWDPAPALDLLRQERFTEALDYVRARGPAAQGDRDVLLLEAVLLAHSGQLVAAEDACLRLLVTDEFNAGAHYILALCREHSGHRERAREHDQVASYLDPGFGMPRLHLGLLARRCGDRETARRELARALFLLEREEASRLLLFGGGFNREALMTLCQSALAECGGRP